jgi:hypothetical protein
MILWVPYNYAVFITIAHVIFLIQIGAGATIPFGASYIIFVIIGLLQTRKDPNWFVAIVNYLVFYSKSPSLMFKRRVSYVA